MAYIARLALGKYVSELCLISSSDCYTCNVYLYTDMVTATIIIGIKKNVSNFHYGLCYYNTGAANFFLCRIFFSVHVDQRARKSAHGRLKSASTPSVKGYHPKSHTSIAERTPSESEGEGTKNYNMALYFSLLKSFPLVSVVFIDLPTNHCSHKVIIVFW